MIKQFHKPASIEEALALKETHGEAVSWFSGGAYLNRIDFEGTFEQVIRLDQLKLDRIQVSDGNLEIGAATTLQEIMDHEGTPQALRQAAREAAPRTIRNLATIGGDIAMGGTTTRLTPCLIALNAKLVVNQQELSLEAFSLQNRNDLITSVIIPLGNRTCRSLKVSHQANSDPVCTVAVSAERSSDNWIANPIIAVGSVESHCRRLTELEEMLQSGKAGDFQAIQAAAANQIQAQADLLGSADYKNYVTGQAVAECVMSCLQGQGGAS